MLYSYVWKHVLCTGKQINEKNVKNKRVHLTQFRFTVALRILRGKLFIFTDLLRIYKEEAVVVRTRKGIVAMPSHTTGGNICFYGECYYCRREEAACAEGEIMEGSVTLWLPNWYEMKTRRHPYQRTYRKNWRAK